MSRWKAQRPVAVMGTPGSEGSAGTQVSGPDQRESGRRGSAKQVGGVGMLLHHVDDFGLNDNQINQLNQMMTDFELEKVDLQAALQKAKITWRSLIRNIDAAESDVMNAIDNVSRAEADLRKMRYRHLKAARSVLQPEQQNNLRTFHLKQSRQKAGGGGGGGAQRGMGGGGGGGQRGMGGGGGGGQRGMGGGGGGGQQGGGGGEAERWAG